MCPPRIGAFAFMGPSRVGKCRNHLRWSRPEWQYRPADMKNLRHTHFGRAVLVLMTLALLSLPFAHRAGAAPITPELTQFLAMGGNLSDICGDANGHSVGGCETCAIVASMMVPPAVQVLHPALVFASSDHGFGKTKPLLPTITRNRPPVRAPPVS